MSSSQGGYQQALEAQISFRLLRGDQPDEILSWFQSTYPADPLANYYAALEGAEQAAENTKAFERLEPGEQFGLLLPQGADIFAEYDVYLNVGIPVPGQGTLWSTAHVRVTPTMTRAEIENEAIRIGQARVLPGMGLGTMEEIIVDEPQVVALRGIVL